jgi:hypothetical protein
MGLYTAAMRIDTFTKIILSLIAVALIAIAVENFPKIQSVSAQEALQKDRLYQESTVPKAWGNPVAFGSDPAFQDASGTIRVMKVDYGAGMTLIQFINRK